MTTLTVARPWADAGRLGVDSRPTDGLDPRGLLWLAGLRALAAIGLLGPMAAFAAGQGDLTRAAWFGAVLALPLVSTAASLMAGPAASAGVLRLQLAADAGVVLLVVWSTGGLVSQYAPLLILPVLAASALMGRASGLRVSAILGCGLVALYVVQHGWVSVPHWLAVPLSSPERVTGPFATYTLAIQIVGVIGVAMLVGQLAESLDETGANLARATSSLANLTTLSQCTLDSMAGGVVAADASGRVVLFNRTAAAITGLQPNQALGRPLVDLLQLPAGWQVGLSQGVPARFEFRFSRHDGEALELGSTISPLVNDHGHVAGELVSFQDLTLIKQRERERQRQVRLAAVGEMAAGIAHEIRNPLASMSGSIQLLKGELDLSAEQEVLLDIVFRESQRLNDTIKDFLAYAGPQRVTRAAVDLRAIIKETAALIVRGATSPGLHQVEVDVPVTEVVHDVDEAQMRQVVWNLASNALKAMPMGGTLRLTTAHVPTPGRREPTLELAVHDTGIGMSPEDVERIFQPFQSGFRQGSGLGLSIVHRIVTDHGGSVVVDSVPGDGTTVRVRVPWSSSPAGVDTPHCAPPVTSSVLHGAASGGCR